MSENNEQKKWKEYCKSQLAVLSPMLYKLGFELEKEQPYIGGERYLMSGDKLVLAARRKEDGKKVIVKTSSREAGEREISEEHHRREKLNNLNFAYDLFSVPEEVFFGEVGSYAVSIVFYMEQEKSFLSFNIKDQFFMTLDAFKKQEGVHATAHSHIKSIKKIFGVADENYYINSFKSFVEYCKDKYTEDKKVIEIMERAESFLIKNKETINRYSGFLTHTDFVPHNFRVVDKNIYLLDHVSLFFGNKYEAWARFLNYLILYNNDLESLLSDYICKNRSEDEVLALRTMRLYKLGELLKYYISTLKKTSGDLLKLNKERILFWQKLMDAILKDKSISEDVVFDYKIKRDQLRSQEEEGRQKELDQLF